MPSTMKAAVVHAFGEPLRIEQVAIPQPGPGEVLVKVVASGVCHTDLHAARGDWPVKPSLPFIPGHEGVGVVAAVGAGVTWVKEGDAVGVPWLHDACGRCTYCTTGWETLCEAQHNTGYGVNGGFAEYVLAKADYVGHLPANVDFDAIAPILCAGVTTYKGLKETEARAGEWVAISGIGGLGHVAVQYAKSMGFHVAALDVDETKLALARRLGADVAVNCSHTGAVERLIEETGGMHGVLVTAVSTAAFGQALGIVRRRGTVALVGLPPGDFPTPIFPVVLKRITVRGSIVGTRQDLAEAIAFAVEGKVKANVTVEPLEAVNDVFARMAAGQIEGRVVLRP
ncbi:alcohol dehydrogenase AdhP [Sphingomonas sp. KRR8]|uniref:alcohol dehydrogenase AdhP n=1 Tax=Sphingomonas sp. KRR8 TaxID=2942996 RepID=UPI00202037B7|nr:alcohol dehydrogenase AdhP [Sphingomonas sp. KRR8]URD59889.1 alcohol dehydrogenase AdhP [Sphingomonas sp. KRR8]